MFLYDCRYAIFVKTFNVPKSQSYQGFSGFSKRWLFFGGRGICGHIFGQIGDGIALGLEIGGGEGGACRRLRINAQGVIDKIGVKALTDDFIDRQVSGQLGDDGADDFQMREFLGTHLMLGNVPFYL